MCAEPLKFLPHIANNVYVCVYMYTNTYVFIYVIYTPHTYIDRQMSQKCGITY